MFQKRNFNSSRSHKSRFGSDGSFQRSGRHSFRPNQSNNQRGGNRRKQRGESIDISRFVQHSADIQPAAQTQIEHTFADFGLDATIVANLKYRRYDTPTPIQDLAIKPILAGRDLIGLANTGTGKTGAFLLPLIHQVAADRRHKVLVIAPTRELAGQIETEFRQFAWNMRIFSAVVVGGMPMGKQIFNLKRNPNFVIGTPGRLKDLADRGVINFHDFRSIVLDEVDRMLDMGFVNEIRAILQTLPDEHQTLFFSATLPPKIQQLTQEFLSNPETVKIATNETARNVDADIVRVREKSYKFTQLTEILRQPELTKVLIFSETKRDVDKLTTTLNGEGFKAEAIHGNKKQSQRTRALTDFRQNKINILVATDVAARGLDIKDISHVINYTIPQTYDDYIHRIGRTGRAGAKGKALTFVEM